MALNSQENILFLWLIPYLKDNLHLRQLKGMQSSKQGMQKGYLFREKGYIKR